MYKQTKTKNVYILTHTEYNSTRMKIKNSVRKLLLLLFVNFI